MSEQVAIAVVGLAGVLLGTVIAGLFALIGAAWQRREETQRWFANYTLSKEFDALSNLYAALVECHLALSATNSGSVDADDHPQSTRGEYARHSEQIDNLQRALAMSALYLTIEEYGPISRAVITFQLLNVILSMHDIAKDRKDNRLERDVDEYKRTAELHYERAIDRLRKTLNTDARRRFAQSFK